MTYFKITYSIHYKRTTDYGKDKTTNRYRVKDCLAFALS